MKYTVKYDFNKYGKSGYTPHCTRKEAIKLARVEVRNGSKGVTISFFRASDGQRGYLNPNGSHAITGNFWE
jgi:hypothetical protein